MNSKTPDFSASPMMNNGMRPMRPSTPLPSRPQMNLMRSNLMQPVRQPGNQAGHQLPSQAHVVHTSQGSLNVPIISVITSPGGVVQQRPKLALQNLMPAQQLKPRTAEDGSVEYVNHVLI